ncbi:hypothetical protein NLJ89_g11684 [Agrocybe chaxingu]|uniref:Uncharacterized protein n=1 Tax=Agrocybe chaxingu TaxID=84603 RepID=A0A9W8JPI9_9AGAR|nr:hypothetical protein NLJ89_g11684 [Agrocybe chaxingu]
MPPTPPSNYVCDTIPAARLATSSDQQLGPDEHAQTPTMDFEPAAVLDDAVSFAASPKSDPEPEREAFSPPPQQPPPRKLCVRHQRMADEGTNLKLQQALDALSVEEREAVSAVWSNFSSSSHPRRALILQGLLTMCCFSQLSLLTEQLAHLIRIDPFAVLPKEVASHEAVEGPGGR